MNTIELYYIIQGFAEIHNQVPTKNHWKTIVAKLITTDDDSTNYDRTDDSVLSSIQFVVWLRGFIKLSIPITATTKQWTTIKDHLQLVFTKATPDRNTNYSTDHPNVILLPIN